MFKNLFFAAVFALALTTGHAYADDSMDDYTQDEGMLESYNRAMFSFNSGFNDYVLIPVSKGYRAITTPFIRNRVSGVLANLREPISMGNYILQGEFKKSGIVLSRFVINSTLGLLGMFDVAEGWVCRMTRHLLTIPLQHGVFLTGHILFCRFSVHLRRVPLSVCRSALPWIRFSGQPTMMQTLIPKFLTVMLQCRLFLSWKET